tara:strand:+ start:2683 stop:3330 length:648 start_codon:yes stop_codon:yes gene_type:complete
MIIQCKNCSRKFVVKDTAIPKEGRTVQCGYCSVNWHQMPILARSKTTKKLPINKSVQKSDDSPSVESIKASDGKTYRFLGTQWAELLPSGKTGLFARKKISQELDEITGRKEKKIIKKKKKKIEEVDPSLESFESEKKLANNYKSKEGMGFFGYIFLIIIVGFSLIGILKTFENDLVNYFPNIEYAFVLLNEQIEFLAESVKNIIVIVSDLINSY